jgi:hypothetical protein
LCVLNCANLIPVIFFILYNAFESAFEIIGIEDQKILPSSVIYSKLESFVEFKISHIHSSHSSIGNNVGFTFILNSPHLSCSNYTMQIFPPTRDRMIKSDQLQFDLLDFSLLVGLAFRAFLLDISLVLIRNKIGEHHNRLRVVGFCSLNLNGQSYHQTS